MSRKGGTVPFLSISKPCQGWSMGWEIREDGIVLKSNMIGWEKRCQCRRNESYIRRQKNFPNHGNCPLGLWSRKNWSLKGQLRPLPCALELTWFTPQGPHLTPTAQMLGDSPWPVEGSRPLVTLNSRAGFWLLVCSVFSFAGVGVAWLARSSPRPLGL